MGERSQQATAAKQATTGKVYGAAVAYSAYVLTHIKAAKMSVFANFGTLITVLAGIVFLKEKLFYYHFLGSLLIIAGVLGTNFLGD